MKTLSLCLAAGLLCCFSACAMFETPRSWLGDSPKTAPEKPPPKPAG